MKYLNELLTILNEMSPYLILGFLISGLLHVYVPKSLYARFLHRKGVGSVVGAALLGVPIPLCSCGVIPTSMSLKKEGASDGATVSFLVSTPQTGIDSILATYSLMGLHFAIIRPVAAFFVAIFGGVLVDKFGESQKNATTATPDYSKLTYAPTDATCSCGCSHDHLHSHSHSHGEAESPKRRFWRALNYGYVELMVDYGKWLAIGLLIAAAITAFVPDSIFATFKDYYLLNILLVLLISAPMYICATGSIPIALSLIMKGLSPGTAFVLLMAGPATNAASLIIFKREIGMRKTVIYLASIIIGSIACALIIDKVLPQEWFSSIADMGAAHHHHHHHGEDCVHDNCGHGPVWWQTTMSALFIALFINSLIQKWRNKGVHSCCESDK